MSTPDATVTITCKDTGHEGREWTVARLGRFVEADMDGVYLPRWTADGTLKGQVLSEVWIGNRTGSQIYDNDQSRLQVFDPPLRKTRLGGHGVYVRYTFRCGLCGNSLVARSERVRPLLERLAQARIDHVDLAQLRAMLK